MEHVVLDPASARSKWHSVFPDWKLALGSIACFWLFYLSTVLLRSQIGPEAASAMGARSLNAGLGLVLTLLIYVVLALFARGASVSRMAIVAAVSALPAAVILSFVSLLLATHMPSKENSSFTTREGVAIVQRGSNVRIVKGNGDELELNLPIAQIIRDNLPRLVADGTVTWYFLFATWSAIFIAMTQQQRTRATELRLAEAETAAHAAHIRALRYQVNPHFLFNTLNSLSSLVMSGRADRAEDMLMALSRFFRTSLSLDPSADVTLTEEIGLQQLYLEIEKVRFPERLQVVIDVPEELGGARVPALILHPLVENAIKYGVSATRDPMLLTIAARRLDGGRMQIDVINRLAAAGPTIPAAAATHEGIGMGLANVCQRLEAHYGDRADCRFGPIAGGYQVSLAVPIDRDD